MRKITVYIETFGCQMNVADSERAMTGLRRAGYTLVNSPEDADVLVYNTCSVRARAEQKVLQRLVSTPVLVEKERKQVTGVMGCVAQLEGESLFEAVPSLNIVTGTRATDRLPELIQRVLNGESRVLDIGERGSGEVWDVETAERTSTHVAFVPVVEGCNKFCTYCIVPYSRGREVSRTAVDILHEVERLREAGFPEIHLIGQNVNSYRPKNPEGLDSFPGQTPFAQLLRMVAATGFPRVKYTTSFPRDFHPDIVAAMDEYDNLCNWIHLPVQSGSDRVLRAMRRGYKSADYLAKVERIRNARRQYALTSDIIVGFPGETVEDFEQTLELVRQCEFHGLYIFKYSERPGTPASRLEDDVADEEKSARFKALLELQNEIQSEIFSTYIGRIVSVLIEGESARSAHDLTGHSTCHKVINFPGTDGLIGRIVDVKITSAKAHSLYGEVVQTVKANCER